MGCDDAPESSPPVILRIEVATSVIKKAQEPFKVSQAHMPVGGFQYMVVWVDISWRFQVEKTADAIVVPGFICNLGLARA